MEKHIDLLIEKNIIINNDLNIFIFMILMKVKKIKEDEFDSIIEEAIV